MHFGGPLAPVRERNGEFEIVPGLITPPISARSARATILWPRTRLAWLTQDMASRLLALRASEVYDMSIG